MAFKDVVLIERKKRELFDVIAENNSEPGSAGKTVREPSAAAKQLRYRVRSRRQVPLCRH
jgi:hypothetical protein